MAAGARGLFLGLPTHQAEAAICGRSGALPLRLFLLHCCCTLLALAAAAATNGAIVVYRYYTAACCSCCCLAANKQYVTAINLLPQVTPANPHLLHGLVDEDTGKALAATPVLHGTQSSPAAPAAPCSYPAVCPKGCLACLPCFACRPAIRCSAASAGPRAPGEQCHPLCLPLTVH